MASEPILPSLPHGDPASSGMTKNEAREFGSAIQEIRHVSKQVAQLHIELRMHMEDEDRKHEEQDKSLNSAHSKIKTINTHLGWIKGIFTVCQASILGWLGLKH